MAPEQARGENTVTPLVDVYSLGAVLYNLLTGRAPYLAATPVDTVMQVLQSEPVAPSRLQPTTPKDLETICLKCLQKQPEKRYGSAEELAEDLRRFRVGEPIHARPVRLAERIWRWSRRNRRVAVLGVVALLLAAVLTIGGPVVAIIVYQQKQIAVSARKESEANEQSAIRAREDALASERVAVQAKGQAQLNEQKAIESQKVAANQGRLALDTLKSLMSDVQQELENQPRMQPLRRKLLKTALGGLDQVATKGVDVRVKDLTMAGAYRRMGDIYLDLGQSEQAFKAFQACHEITDELHKQKALPNPESNLSFSLSNLGEAARRGGRLPQAKEYLLSALKIRQEWAQAESKNPLLLQNVAETLGRLGNVCLMLGQATEA
jgi:serine/threonine-protein kinase